MLNARCQLLWNTIIGFPTHSCFSIQNCCLNGHLHIDIPWIPRATNSLPPPPDPRLYSVRTPLPLRYASCKFSTTVVTGSSNLSETKVREPVWTPPQLSTVNLILAGEAVCVYTTAHRKWTAQQGITVYLLNNYCRIILKNYLFKYS